MRRAAYVPQSLAYQVFLASDAVAAGLLTPSTLRSPQFRLLRYGVHADARLEEDHHLVCRAAALTLPPAAVIAGRSAAYLLGVDSAASFSDPVEVVLPPSAPLGPRSGLLVHQTTVDSSDVETLGWCRRTSALRTAWDVAVWHDLLVAVPILDSMLGANIVSTSMLDDIAAERRRAWGGRRASRTIRYADGRAQSPPESVLRVRLQLAGFPPAVPQCPVPVGGGVVLHPDLGWPEYQVGTEYDGAWHADTAQLHRDRRRLNQLAAAGWIVLHVTSQRMARDWLGFTRELRTALMSRGWPGPPARSRLFNNRA